MNTTEFLEAMREKIATPDRWIKEKFAATSDGDGVGPENERAHCFCLVGAARAVSRSAGASFLDSRQWHAATKFLYRAIEDEVGQFVNVVNFNDRTETDHPSVLRVLDRAIALSKEAPQ